MTPECPRCGGLGVRPVVLPNGHRAVEPCQCQAEQRGPKLLRRAGIPERYVDCSFENFETKFVGADESLRRALVIARRFVEEYPITTGGQGLLFTGSIGVGKTHLAVSVLKALIAEKGARAIFCHYRELLKNIGHSYNPQVAATEMDILQPVFQTEVLLLDELGAVKPNSWIFDTVALVLNSRYNAKLTTIITTNLEDKEGASPEPAGISDGEMVERARLAARQHTLGDRIGETMRSRLAQMCVVVEMHGQDFRQKVARARFG